MMGAAGLKAKWFVYTIEGKQILASS